VTAVNVIGLVVAIVLAFFVLAALLFAERF
jgi:hypothetical protein